MEQYPEQQLTKTPEIMAGLEQPLPNGNRLFKRILDKAGEHPFIASAVAAGAVAVGSNAIPETSKASHVDPHIDYDKEYESRGAECMANFRQQTGVGGTLVQPRANNGLTKNKKAAKVRFKRAEITTFSDYSDENACTENEFYAGVKSWIVIKNDKGQFRRASRVVTLANHTSKEINKDINFALTTEYTCKDGPKKRAWGVRTRSIGVSRQANDRDRFVEFYSGKEFRNPRSQFC